MRKTDTEYFKLEAIRESGVNPDSREIFLNSYIDNTEEEPGIDYRTAVAFVKNIRYLEGVGNEPVRIHLQTVGGEWGPGMAIYDSIKFSPCHIVILGYAEVRSMSSLIFQAGDVRVLMPNTSFLMHFGTLEYSGNTISALAEAKWCGYLNDVMLDIYVKSCQGGEKFEAWETKRIKRYLNDLMLKKQELYLTASEAVEWGLADGVLGSPPFVSLEDVK